MDENDENVTFSDVLNEPILTCASAVSKIPPGTEEHVVITKELISLCESKAKCVETDLRIETEEARIALDRKAIELKERELDLKERELSYNESKDKFDNVYRWTDRGLKALGTAAFLTYAVGVLKAECEDNQFMHTSAWRLISSGLSKFLVRPPM